MRKYAKGTFPSAQRNHSISKQYCDGTEVESRFGFPVNLSPLMVFLTHSSPPVCGRPSSQNINDLSFMFLTALTTRQSDSVREHSCWNLSSGQTDNSDCTAPPSQLTCISIVVYTVWRVKKEKQWSLSILWWHFDQSESTAADISATAQALSCSGSGRCILNGKTQYSTK